VLIIAKVFNDLFAIKALNLVNLPAVGRYKPNKKSAPILVSKLALAIALTHYCN
jgi:hypothetical protein